jgi:hypothetical protein
MRGLFVLPGDQEKIDVVNRLPSLFANAFSAHSWGYPNAFRVTRTKLILLRRIQ